MIDFSKTEDHPMKPSGKPGDPGAKPKHRRDGNPNAPRTPEGKLLTPKQIRARARRRSKRAETMSEAEFNALYKPIEEWDLEELARGRPRNSRGGFSGPNQRFISREVHEKAMERFRSTVKTEMNRHTVNALDVFDYIIQNDERDEKGKPIIPAGTKLEAAKFLLEHVVGKPTQRVENDVSVKLQAILGVVMANPDDALNQGGYNVGHLPGVTMPMAGLPGADDTEDAVIVDDDEDLDVRFE